MRAWIAAEGCPGQIRMGRVARPQPKTGEVLVAVEAYSINRGETLLLERPRPGWRPGKDAAGTVVQPAGDGRGPRSGTRVVAHPPDGAWAEQVAVPVEDIAEIPADVSAATAAALPLAGLTAMRLLRGAGPLDGRRLLITGASGGVGHYVVELAAAAGADVTAVSASAERGARLLQLGAMRVCNDIADAGGPFDVVMESVGGTSLRAALTMTRPNGLVLWFGQASREPTTLDFFEFFDQPVDAHLSHFDYTRSDRSYGEDLRSLVNLVHTRRLHPEIGLVRPWTESQHVIAELRGRRIRGNAVLTLGADDHQP